MMRLRSTLLLTALLTFVATARAQDAGDVGEARRHYVAGERAFNLQRYDQAIKEFTLSYEISGDRNLLYNLAQTYRSVKDVEHSCNFYRTFMASYVRRHQTPPREREIRARIETCNHPPPIVAGAAAPAVAAEHPPVPAEQPAHSPRDVAPPSAPVVVSAPSAAASAVVAPAAQPPVYNPGPRLRFLGVTGVAVGALLVAVGGGLVGVGAHDAGTAQTSSRPTLGYEVPGMVIGAVGLGALVAGIVGLARAHQHVPLWASYLPSVGPRGASWTVHF